MQTDEWFLRIHERLLQRDPVAPAELAEVVFRRLVSGLRKQNPKLTKSDLIEDAATDAFMNYVKVPDTYDPTKCGLFRYLSMSANGDLRNALAKRKRRFDKEIAVGLVEELQLGGNSLVDEKEPMAESENAALLEKAKVLFNNPTDHRVLDLIIRGERSTATFVEVLSLQGLPIDRQRREVKRHKDRVKKWLERHGKSITKAEE